MFPFSYNDQLKLLDSHMFLVVPSNYQLPMPFQEKLVGSRLYPYHQKERMVLLFFAIQLKWAISMRVGRIKPIKAVVR